MTMDTVDYEKVPRDLLPYVQDEQFGRQASEFMDSPVGLFLLGRAEQEALAALNELAESDASDIEHMRELQLVVRRANSIRDWLEEAIACGKSATEFLNQAGHSDGV